MSVVSRFLEAYYRRLPVNATFTGVHIFDHRLPDWSPEGLDSWSAELKDLASEHPPDLAPGDRASRIDTLLARTAVDIHLDEITGDHFYRRNPALFTGEAVFSIIALTTRDFAPPETRWAHVQARLDAVPGFLDAARRTLSYPVPALWIARARREAAAASTFFTKGLPADASAHAVFSVDDTARAERAARAFADFDRWLDVNAAVAAADHPLGAGPELFHRLLRRGHGVAVPWADLWKEASERLAEAHATLTTLARAADPGGWPAVQARLSDDHPTADAYLAVFDREWQACRAAACEANLVAWPDLPLRYVPIPSHTRAVAPALYYLFYRSPAPDDHAVMHEAVVTPIDGDLSASERRGRLRTQNMSVIRLNHVIHHGALGHHVQNAFAARSASRIGRIAAVDCASRIGLFCGGSLAEGWACYAVDLMEEIGYLSPLEQVSQQHTRVRILARALLDLGIHARLWTPDTAVAFWQETVGVSREAAVGEVTKASMFPGTAIMYWLGTQGIHDLRADRARVEGAAFSLRAFHDALLKHGSIPVPIIARLMAEGGVA